MKKRTLYISSNEYDFLKEPIYLKSFKLVRKGFHTFMIANLKSPINIWYNQRLHIYSSVILKPRYLFQSLRKLKKNKSISVNIASFDGKDSENFKLSELNSIGFGNLYCS